LFIVRKSGKNIPEKEKRRCFELDKKAAAKTGFLSGILNGLFGSGGGIIAVSLLKKSGIEQKESQATALLLMFFLSAVSVGIYYFEGRLSFPDAAAYIPGGILGGIAAALVFRKMNPNLLRKIFGGFVTFSAARMLWGILEKWIF